MQNTEEFLNRIKLKIKLKDYNSANEMLRKEIKIIFTKKIKEKDKDFGYTNIANLSQAVKKYLSGNYNNIFDVFYNLINEENTEDYELDCLIEIYSKLINKCKIENQKK